jgi:xylulokinase
VLAAVTGSCTLGLDLGTSSAKAVVTDTGGRVLAQAAAGYAVTSMTPGYAESEPAEWWSAVTACAREAVDTAGHVAGVRPSAIGLAGQMHGLVMASADGRALRPALLWADSRATGSLRAYRHLGAQARARLANPLAPGMTGPLLMWVAEHEPGTYRAARWALAPKDWLRARLTGEIHAEPSDASASLLYDVPGDRWDLEVVGALGLDAGLLAPLLPSAGAPAGHLTARAADELGLPAGIPVAAGAGDTAAATLGSGIGLGEVQVTIGTGAQVIRPLAGAVSRADDGVHLYRSATPAGWYQMGATLSAGLSLNWVREVMNASWAELYASADPPGRPGRGPIFVPHLSGERTPYCDPALRGSWTGLSLADDRASLLRGALEGVAFAIRDALDALLGEPQSSEPRSSEPRSSEPRSSEPWSSEPRSSEQGPPHLRLAGGGTLAAGWRQLLADVLGLPLYAVDVPAASGRGAALLGAVAAGLLSFDDIAGPLAPPASLVAEPDPAIAASRAERHARFRHIVSVLQPEEEGAA